MPVVQYRYRDRESDTEVIQMLSNKTLKTVNIRLCVLLIIAALLLAGCSSSGGSSGRADSGEAPAK